jgi:hypothetical protein
MQITPELRDAVWEYHAYHNDSHARIIQTVKDPQGYECLLVRMTDAEGKKYSCIDMVDGFGRISELVFCERQKEAEMVKAFETDTLWEVDKDV